MGPNYIGMWVIFTSVLTDSGLANGYIEEAPAILLWVADLSRNHDMTVADGLNPGVHEYLDSFVMATVDASLASQNESPRII